MTNIFFDNLHLWQKQTDIDYFTHFMKTWLVFNAWMYHTTQSEQDRANINHVKEQANTFRNRMLSGLRLNDDLSNAFRQHIGSLKVALDRAILLNKGEEIRFDNAFIGDNPQRMADKTFNRCYYKVEFPNLNNHTNNVIINNSTSGASIFNESNTRYDLNWLQNHINYSPLTPERKRLISECYKLVNPKLYKNLLTLDTREGFHIKCGTVHLINDEETVSKGLIEMLYRLRCILFHGELVPNQESSKVYEHCYFILKMIIDRLS